ncbi:acyl-CoA dehydrogenase [Nocardioides sp. Root1257]|uniref:acyl-CoA dehydrogenase family protein n=1 Tax=unclassified Nocardioides TaxID=2615069 RepID=UPI0006FD3410|nr:MULTISPECIES: acyl-CoA dehydrogenase family protein [unclassified Nocardioides]KQW45125.1 acyl-CoA dehydrogenase [Nocardioides sp. Root1257]KRC45871.1 acyl-CoA dehydrogenase [Nocardioides sp. Root224]
MTITAPISSQTLTTRAAALGPELASHAARHDADGTFVSESYDALRDSGLLAAAVPVELGGDGATIAELTALQRELAHHCGSTALASAMHQHVVAFTAWRYRRGLPGAEATLRRVAEEGIVLVSTGGGDYTHPRGDAVKVDGGYRVSGTKRFASQSRHGTVLSTMFTYDDPEQGRRVLNVAVPVASAGVTVADNWDTLGMRGTASNDIELEDVFVPDERVLANRPYGVVDGPLQVISSIAFPIISGVYLGVAEAAYAEARAAAGLKSGNVLVQRQVGRMKHALQVASWALDGALGAVGDDPEPSHDTYLAVMIAKAEVARAGIEVCDLAMDVVGGPGYFRGSVVERAYRDIRAAKFHPLTPEATQVATGRHELGESGLLQ